MISQPGGMRRAGGGGGRLLPPGDAGTGTLLERAQDTVGPADLNALRIPPGRVIDKNLVARGVCIGAVWGFLGSLGGQLLGVLGGP